MARLKVYPQNSPLKGTITPPGDKSISHRAVMLAALAQGESRIRGWLPAGDTLASLEAMMALGVQIEANRKSIDSWDLRIEGVGLAGLKPPTGPLDCRNAGTCMRLLAGILGGQSFHSVLDGSEQLRRRPMDRIIKPLRQMGVQIEALEDRAPLRINPADLRGIEYRLPVASAQVKSAILLAGLFAHGRTQVHEPGPARDHTERMLQAMGVDLSAGEGTITLSPPHPPTSSSLHPLDLTVPGDFSSAAFPLVAAAIVPHSEIIIQGSGVNRTRTGLLEILEAMGGRITIAEQRETGGESVANLRVGFDELHRTGVGGSTVVRTIDEFPIWAIAATQAAGISRLQEAAELRVKEVDRISVLAGELAKMGVEIDEQADGMTIAGPTRLRGVEVNGHGDHRLGMALAVAGLAAAEPTIVSGADSIADSFPGFVETMQSLGARMEWLD